MEITIETYNALKTLTERGDGVDIAPSHLIKLLKFLFYYIEIKTETKLKSGVALVDFIKYIM